MPYLDPSISGTRIRLRRSFEAGDAPAAGELRPGEPAINVADGIMYAGRADGTAWPAIGYKEYAATVFWSTQNQRLEPRHVFSNTLGGPVLWGSQGTPAGVISYADPGAYLTLPEPVRLSQWLMVSGSTFSVFDSNTLVAHWNVHLGLNSDPSVPSGFYPEVHIDTFDANDESAPHLINYYTDFHFAMRIYPLADSQ